MPWILRRTSLPQQGGERAPDPRPGEVWLPESGTEHISVVRAAT